MVKTFLSIVVLYAGIGINGDYQTDHVEIIKLETFELGDKMKVSALIRNHSDSVASGVVEFKLTLDCKTVAINKSLFKDVNSQEEERVEAVFSNKGDATAKIVKVFLASPK